MTGLSLDEVEQRMKAGQFNRQMNRTAKTQKDIIKENVFTYFNLIFAVLAILCILGGSFKSLTFVPVVVANACIGIVQELHAKKILDELSLLNEPNAQVLRAGSEQTVPVKYLVLDDLIVLRAGNQIPADAKVVRGSVSVNEALLTGEADEIEKQPGAELMSGSYIVSGECYAQLTRVGKDSYINQLMMKARKMKGEEQSEMVRSINRIVIAAGILIVPVGGALFYQSYFVQGLDFTDSVTSMVAALIGMIPEGMYLLVSIALAMSAAKLAQKKVMLHDMKSTETLARVDVLCLDKTGTITDNAMLVARVEPATEMEEAQIHAYHGVVADYLQALPDNNQTMQALRKYFVHPTGATPTATMPFSSKYKYSFVQFGTQNYVLGAPEKVLLQSYDAYKARIEHFAQKGLRVMVFGKYMGEGAISESRPLTPADAVTPLFFLLLQNPVRDTAPQTLQYFRDQDVEVKVISGDHAMTVAEVARQAGIAGADRFVDCATLRSPEAVYDAAEKYTVFGRTTPEQKQLLIQALKERGHTVAMTGDGVNDILAMKTADCSIAMATGSDAAAQAAQVVLLDSDFAKMPKIVAEGRQTINNLERSATLFLVKNIFSLLLAVFSIINVLTYPLQPSQISLISLFNIGIPAFCLAIEPNEKRIEGRFLPRVLLKSMPAALTNFFVIAALVVFGNTFSISEENISVAATFLMAIVGFMILWRISEPMNHFHWCVLIGCMIGFCIVGYLLRDLFEITRVSKECIMLFALFAIATEPCMRYLTRFFAWVESLFERPHKKKRVA